MTMMRIGNDARCPETNLSPILNDGNLLLWFPEPHYAAWPSFICSLWHAPVANVCDLSPNLDIFER